MSKGCFDKKQQFNLTLKPPWFVSTLVCYILGSGKCTLSDCHDAVAVIVLNC